MARRDSLGGRRARRRRSTERIGAARRLAVGIAAALAAHVATSQTETPWYDQQRALAARARGVEAAEALPEYRAYAEALSQHVAQLDREPTRKELLSHARSWADLASLEVEAELDARLDWLEVAAASALRARSGELYARVRETRARLLSLAGRNVEAREELAGLLADTATWSLRYRPEAQLGLAEVERQLGRFADALGTLDRCAAELPGDHPARGRLEQQMAGLRGQIHLDLGNADSAEPWITGRLDRAEAALASRRGDPQASLEVIVARLRRLDLALVRDRHARVLSLSDRYLTDGTFDDVAEPHASLLKGLMHVQRGKALVRLERVEGTSAEGRARAALERALAESSLPQRARVDALLELAHVHTRDGRFDRAESSLAEARERIEEFAPREAGVAPPERIQLATLRARLSLARGAGREELEARRAELVDAFDELSRLWSLTPILKGGVGFFTVDWRAAVVLELARVHLALDSRQDGALAILERLLAIEAHGTLARGAGLDPVSIGDVRAELLDAGRGAVVYLTARDESLALAFDRDRATLALLPGEDELQTARNAFLQAVFRGGEDELDDAARELGDRLLPDEIRRLLNDWTGVTIVGTDALGAVPYAALPSADGEPLGCVFALDELPSLTLGVGLARREPRTRRRDLCLIADSHPSGVARDLGRGLDELGLSRERLSALADAHGDSTLLVGARATPDALFEHGPESRVLQLLVHGVVDPERQRRAGLVLTPSASDADGIVWAGDVERHATADFVLLTACRSGSAPARPGDAAAARISTAFLTSGASVVLDSSHDLALEPTLVLSEALHAGLAAGRSPAEALRDACQATQAAGWSSPAHFALVHLTGLGHRPLF